MDFKSEGGEKNFSILHRCHLTRLRADPSKIDGQFLAHYLFLIWKKGAFTDKCKHWVNQSALPKDELAGTVVPVPSIAEQKQIVNKLRHVLPQIQAIQARLDKIPVLLQRFRQSVLSAACSGRLTADWRESYQNPKLTPTAENLLGADCAVANLNDLPLTWKCSTIIQVAEIKGGKRLPKGQPLETTETGQPYIRATNLKNGTVSGELLYVPNHLKGKIQNYVVRAADAYITIVGACIGDAGTIPPFLDGANLTENAARLRGMESCSSCFIAYWLRSPFCQDVIKSNILSAAQGKLALFRIGRLPIPLPPIPEQKEIIQRVEALFKFADAIEAKYNAARAKVDKLSQSILSKAFRGEFVLHSHKKTSVQSM